MLFYNFGQNVSATRKGISVVNCFFFMYVNMHFSRFVIYSWNNLSLHNVPADCMAQVNPIDIIIQLYVLLCSMIPFIVTRVRHELHTFFLVPTRQSESKNDDKTDNFYTSTPCLIRSVYILVMTSQWPNICDAITWIIISNPLDIDFLHGDIHGQVFKKKRVIVGIK